jgi:hypothetical protein
MYDFIDEAFRLRKKLDLWFDIVEVPFDIFLEAGFNGVSEIHLKEVNRANSTFADHISSALRYLPKDVIIALCLSAAYIEIGLAAHRDEVLSDLFFLNMAAEEIGFCRGTTIGLSRANERRRIKLSANGKKGALALHEPTIQLKAWALSKAEGMRGAPKDISRKLAKQIPAHLADVSKDPERLIYEALLKQAEWIREAIHPS